MPFKSFVFYKWLSAIGIAFIYYFSSGKKLLKKDTVFKKGFIWVLLSGISLIIYSGTSFLAINEMELTNFSLLISLCPLFILFFSLTLLKEKFHIIYIPCTALSVIGVFLIFEFSLKNTDFLNIFGILSVIFLALKLIFAKKAMIESWKAADVAFLQITISFLASAILFSSHPTLLTFNEFFFIIILGTFAYFAGLARAIAYSIERVSFLSNWEYLKVVIAVIFGVFFLHESISVYDYIGALLIFLASFLITKYKKE